MLHMSQPLSLRALQTGRCYSPVEMTLQDTLAKSFLLGIAFNKHSSGSDCPIKEAVEIHSLLKKTGDVGKKLSSGHKRERIK